VEKTLQLAHLSLQLEMCVWGGTGSGGLDGGSGGGSGGDALKNGGRGTAGKATMATVVLQVGLAVVAVAVVRGGALLRVMSTPKQAAPRIASID
jgi:hypothetical protein